MQEATDDKHVIAVAELVPPKTVVADSLSALQEWAPTDIDLAEAQQSWHQIWGVAAAVAENPPVLAEKLQQQAAGLLGHPTEESLDISRTFIARSRGPALDACCGRTHVSGVFLTIILDTSRATGFSVSASGYFCGIRQ